MRLPRFCSLGAALLSAIPVSASAIAGTVSIVVSVPLLDGSTGEAVFATVTAVPDFGLQETFALDLTIDGVSFELFRDPIVTSTAPSGLYGELPFLGNPAHETCATDPTGVDCVLLDGGFGFGVLVTGPAVSTIVFPHFVPCASDVVPNCRLLSSVTGIDAMNVDLVVTSGASFGGATASANVAYLGEIYVLVPEPGTGLHVALGLLVLSRWASRRRASAGRPSPRRAV